VLKTLRAFLTTSRGMSGCPIRKREFTMGTMAAASDSSSAFFCSSCAICEYSQASDKRPAQSWVSTFQISIYYVVPVC
jgi:hypothetical protein